MFFGIFDCLFAVAAHSTGAGLCEVPDTIDEIGGMEVQKSEFCSATTVARAQWI